MFDWNDLQPFLGVARHGSTIAAAKALGINQSTVTRRIAELERRLGHPLFTRSPAGYYLNGLGKLLLPEAEAAERAIIALNLKAQNFGAGPTGIIRLTCPEPLAARLSASSLIESFHARYPELRVEFVMSDGYLDLMRGEADIALRSGEADDEHLVGRKIADSIWALYASRNYIQQRGRPSRVAELGQHSIVGFDGALSQHRAAKWLARFAPDAHVAARNNSVLGVLLAVKSGIGVSPLPTTIADSEEELVQVFPPIAELQRGWYLLTHPDLRQTARVDAFFTHVLGHLDDMRTILMG